MAKKKKLTMDYFMGPSTMSRKKYRGKHLCFDAHSLELVTYGKDLKKVLDRADKMGIRDTALLYLDE